MNMNQFTQKTIRAIQDAQRLAVEYQNNAIEQEHLLAALCAQQDGLIPQLLTKMGVEPGNFLAAATEKPCISRALLAVSVMSSALTIALPPNNIDLLRMSIICACTADVCRPFCRRPAWVFAAVEAETELLFARPRRPRFAPREPRQC